MKIANDARADASVTFDRGGDRRGMSSGRETTTGVLVLAGVSHHTAPVAVRERLAAGCAADGAGVLPEAVRRACGPAVVLATCNRLEVYCWVPGRPAPATRRLLRLLADQAGARLTTLRPHVYTYTGVEAVRHLIRVTSGLDSLALGECQIIGQVRDAFLASASQAPLGPDLHLIFRHALDAARRIRNLGAFDRHPSVAAIAVHVAGHEMGGAPGRDVAVLGAGVTGKATVRAFAAAGVRRVRLLNRSPDHARSVANTLALGDRVTIAPLDDLPQALATCDALICATAAARPVVTTATVAAALSLRAGRPLVIVDIAVPRDVEPEVRHLPGAILVDLDDLEARCALDPTERRHELDRVERSATDAAQECLAALRARAAVPEIVALRRRGAAIREAELRRWAGRLNQLAPADRAAVEQLTHAIVQKLLHPPTVALRRASARGGATARRTRAAILQALSPNASTAPAIQGMHGMHGHAVSYPPTAEDSSPLPLEEPRPKGAPRARVAEEGPWGVPGGEVPRPAGGRKSSPFPEGSGG